MTIKTNKQKINLVRLIDEYRIDTPCNLGTSVLVIIAIFTLKKALCVLQVGLCTMTKTVARDDIRSTLKV